MFKPHEKNQTCKGPFQSSLVSFGSLVSEKIELWKVYVAIDERRQVITTNCAKNFMNLCEGYGYSV